jgi:hypothetical protein
MNEKQIPALHPAYLLKIILGLIVLAGLIVAAHRVSLSGSSPFTRYLLLGGVIVILAAIVPLVGHIYRKMDELQKVHHQNACVATLPIVAAAAAIIGILQLGELIPPFNQIWIFGGAVCLWAVNLMLADQHYR